MSGGKVSDVILGELDYSGKAVVTIFSKVSGVYVVYANSDRVMVQYADDDELARDQRRIFAFLAPIRGEINGLIDGWRHSRLSGLNSKARRYDRRTADALVVAMQGDQETAKALLQAVRNDILEERTSLGRLHYLGMALAVGLVISLVSWLLTITASIPALKDIGAFFTRYDLWMTSSLGCLGAIFSIAIGIRGRAIETDLRPRDNLIDAGLRMLIGAISAFLLLTLFRSHLVSLSLGGGEDLGACQPGECSANGVAVIIAFLAGFSERLVGDLLDSKIIPGLVQGDTSVDVASRTAAVSPPPDSGATASRAELKGELNPLGKVTPAIPSAVEDPAEQAEDGCLCDHEVDDTDTTDDVELPRASGGIDRPAS